MAELREFALQSILEYTDCLVSSKCTAYNIVNHKPLNVLHMGSRDLFK